MHRKSGAGLKLYWFGWPSHVGGADTKLAHTLWLLHRDYDMTVVPNTREQLEQAEWREWLHRLGIKTALLEELPRKLEGWAVSLCNGQFWAGGVAVEARSRGLKVAWSSEMMWHHPLEQAAAQWGLMDKVLYTSEVQRKALEAGYAGVPGVPGVIVGNYIAPELFPWQDRTKERRFGEFVIGRLSRPDPGKYPRDFPESYLRLGLENARYRVMAWSEEMAKQYPNDNARPHPGPLPQEREDGSRRLAQSDASGKLSCRDANHPLPQERENGSRRLAQSDASEKLLGCNTDHPLPEGEGRGEGTALPESQNTSELWKPARFVGTWDLLAARAEKQVDFLHSLDWFVYDLREDCS